MRSLLVANRGEIAARIFRTCDRLGIATVAVVADDDGGAYHASIAGKVEPVRSYLDAGELVRAALATGAEAVHPGYGFLAENGDFAERCAARGLTWVGPPAAAIRAAGDKLEAKRLAESLGVPVLPSAPGDEVGYPLVVKAAAGGGGRGMRVVHDPGGLPDALEAASREAKAAFGDGTVFCERYLERPRHVEAQLLADGDGRVVALGERDCSIQRRNQKVLEECPAPGLDGGTRGRLADAATRIPAAVGYESAGTAEFLVDGEELFFLELNARIQVEHPVTELVGALDLVEWQLRVADGEALDVAWHPSGHAVEARLYAEHPLTFAPQPGRVRGLVLPDGVRVDAGVAPGGDVPLAYDPLIAKLVAHGATRDEALDRLAVALDETVVTGVTTNLPLLRWLVAHPTVRAGEATTAFLAEYPPLSKERRPRRPWAGYWRAGRDPRLPAPPRRPPPVTEQAARASAGSAAARGEVRAPTPGRVVRVLVRAGQPVEAREPVLVIEAMKMETPLAAPYGGIVSRVRVAEGDRVGGGDLLVELEAT